MPKQQVPRPRGRQRRSWIRTSLLAIGIVLALAMVLLVLAPTILSTSWAKGIVERQVAKSGAGTLAIEDLRISWGRGLEARGIAFQSAEGEIDLKIDGFGAETPLWRLAVGGRDLGTVRIERPVLRLVPPPRPPAPPTPPDPAPPVVRPTPPVRPPAEPAALRLPLRARLSLDNGEVEVAHPEFEPVLVRNLFIDIDARDPASGIVLRIAASAQQGDLGGSIEADGRVTGFDADGSFFPNALRAEGVLEAVDLPVNGIDAILAADGLLTAAVGDRLDLRLSAGHTGSSPSGAGTESSVLRFAVRSRNLNGQAGIAAEGDRVAGDGEIRWTITPEFADACARPATAPEPADDPSPGFRLERSVDARLRLVSFETAAGEFRPGQTAFVVEASIDDGSALIEGDVGSISWSGVRTQAVSTNLAGTVNAGFDAKIARGDDAGVIRGQAAVSRLFDAGGRLSPVEALFDGGLDLRDLPTGLVDNLAGAEGWLRDALGSAFSVSIAAERRDGDDVSLRLAADSPQVRLRLPLRVAERIRLESDATLLWTPSPEMDARLAGDPSMQIAMGAPVELVLGSFDAPLPRDGAVRDWAGDTRIEARLAAGDVGIRIPARDGEPERRFTAERVDLRLHGDSILAPEANASLLVRLEAEDAPETVALGEELSADVRVRAALGEDLQPETVEISATARSGAAGPLRAFSFDARLEDEFRSLRLTQPARALYVLSPERYDRLMAQGDGQPRLRAESEIELSVERLEAALAPFHPGSLAVEAALSCPGISMDGPADGQRLDLAGLKASLSLDGPGNSLDLRAEAQARAAGAREAGSLVVSGRTRSWIRDGAIDLPGADHDLSVVVKDLPTDLVDAFTGTDGLLPLLVGPALAVDARVRSSDAAETAVEFAAGAERLRASASLTVDARSGIEAREPARLSWTCTPEAWARLTRPEDGEGGADLVAPLDIDAAIESLRIPFLASRAEDEGAGGGIDVPNTSLNANLTVGPASWRMRETADETTVRDLVVGVGGENLNAVLIRAAGSVHAVTPGGEPASGRIDVDARVADLFSASGALDPANASVAARVRAAEIPVDVLRPLGDPARFASATFGDRVSIELDAEIDAGSGPLGASLQSGNASASFRGRFGEGKVTLEEPVTAQVAVTEELGRFVLSRIHPVFDTAQTADRPLLLTIPPQGVVIPVADFRLQDLRVPVMRWELGADDPETGEYAFGTLELGTGGLLSGLLSFAQQRGRLASQRTDMITLRMTPLILKLEDGVLDYDRRLDLIVNESFRIATWGRVALDTDPDPARDTSSLDLFLGIPGRTLDDTFGLDGIPPDELFTIPVRGTTTGTRVDWQAAAADLAGLSAQARLAKDPLTGAIARRVLRDLLGGKAPPAPPPSVSPVPWLLAPQPAAEAEPGTAETEPVRATPPAETAPPPDPIGGAIRGILRGR